MERERQEQRQRDSHGDGEKWGGGGEKPHVHLQLVFCTYVRDSMCVSAPVCCLSRQIHLGINRMIFPPAGSKAAKG